ncbi:T9SS type A sorting domain-containing protein [Dyadobacter sp. CY323]|uniref:T9SS type A sorting domain-containing protein n=1 Tax=Dyadobacter sp. CY323 TaxID=2907302 RepID=UPI001F3A33E3|nr:T9SS type A sorting domain-containing protein [Dyadobacter sp. CY323]MCE6989267.1 T9SS type A sorting domain-containing protein [Dyadobacter sp. CY323]
MHVKTFTLLIFLHTSLTALAQLNVNFPPARMVYQRNTSGNAVVFINGTYTASIDKIEARLKNRGGEPGSEVGWTEMANVSGNVFSGSLTAVGGRYDLEVRGMKNGQQVGSSATVEKVGVGEVFLIVGHSNAAAAGESIDMLGAESDLVNSINTKANPQLYQDYLTFGTADYLPPLQPTKLCQSCGIAPMAEYPWLWSRLGDLLVAPDALNVPVLFYSAAFGGSNMDATYKSAYNIPFDHGFIKYSIRMPYANIRNTMNAYAPRTGLRAILSMHGINDLDATADEFKFRSQMVIEKTREESGYQQLPWMIATSCYNNGVVATITAGQEALISTVPNVFRGADLNKILNDGRYDGLHFNGSGQQQAAQRWRDAILDPVVNIRQNAQSFMASAPPLPGPPLPVTLIQFRGKKTAYGPNELEWVTSSEKNNDYFEIQSSTDAVQFEVIGNVKGVGDSKENVTYSFSDETPAKSVTYYRLKQVDFDGTESLSRIIAVQGVLDTFDEFVYPNPAQHYIEIATDNGETVEELTLFDLKGNTLLKKSKSAQVDVSKLSKGDYFIQFKLSSGASVRKKIAKM